MECLENIIGITNADCECLLSGLTPEQIADAKKSTSGLYLDGNLEGGVALAEVKLLENCGDYFNLAKKAITAAQKAFYDDIQIAIGAKYKSVKSRFIGELGRLQYAGVMAANKPIQYLKITPLTQSLSVMKINNVRLIINTTKQAVTVKLLQVLDGLSYGDVVFEAEVNTTANRFVSVDIPVNLQVPLSINNRKINYFFVWERTAGELPMDNSTSCGCSGGDAYSQYVRLSGGQADDYDTLGVDSDVFAHGLSVDAEIFCETGGLVCSEFRKEDRIALVSAWSVLYKAGELLIEYVLQSPEINRFTMMSREYLWGKRNHFKAEYNNRIQYLGGEIDITANDCFVCRDRKMFVGNVYG
jgi:hypothetical protein